MHILFLTQLLPYPLDAGAKVRQYYVLRYLAARHQVTLVCFGRDSDSADAVSYLRGFCREVHVVPMQRSRVAEATSLGRSLLTGQPYTILRDAKALMYRQLDALLREESFDAIHADQLAMAQYALYAQAQRARTGRSAPPKMVMDAHNAYYLIPQRMAAVSKQPAMRLLLRREAQVMARYERNTYQRFDHVLTVTKQDLDAIHQLGHYSRNAPQFEVIPICVDASTPPVPRQPDAHGLLMLGGLHWPPNADAARWFAHDIWPHVSSQVRDAQLFIVGARPPDDIRQLADCFGVQRPEQAGGAPVVVSGYVPDAQPFLSASAVLIVALRSGGGMRVKIIEALQWGIPVVSTTIGCEGINLTPGRDALIEDDPQKFAAAVLSVLQDPELARRLSEQGRALVRQQYDWQKVYAAFDAIYH
jgi:glycosyltransferase involved in cell wall biosynthesis